MSGIAYMSFFNLWKDYRGWVVFWQPIPDRMNGLLHQLEYSSKHHTCQQTSAKGQHNQCFIRHYALQKIKSRTTTTAQHTVMVVRMRFSYRCIFISFSNQWKDYRGILWKWQASIRYLTGWMDYYLALAFLFIIREAMALSSAP